MWIFDKLFNRKIEGKSSLDNVIDENGAIKVQPQALNGLTHSLNELDATLKQIVDDAIADAGQNGVACTQEQWNGIKQLLNKSLYLSYEGISMIKCVDDGFTYIFGYTAENYGYRLEVYYEETENLLKAVYRES